MADVRCPMCSTVNPEGQATCKVCGARLTPVSNEIAANNFQSIHPGDEPTKKSTAELEQALPDWLQDLRKKQETGELQSPSPAGGAAAASAAPSFSAESDDDFLSRLASESGQDASAAIQPDSTDWLAGLSDTKGSDEDIPDWLLGVKQSVDEEAQAAKLAASQPAPEDNVDWFKQLQEDQKAAKGEDASQWPGFYSETPGFGKGPDQPPLSRAESADWFMPAAESKGPEVADPNRSTGVTDWLKKMQDQENKTPGQPPAVPISGNTSAAPLPDWLSFVQQPSAPVEPETPAPAAAGELPDWLSGFQPDQPSSADALPAAPAASEGLPDWLVSAQGAQPSASAALPPQAEQSEPDWLSTFAGAPTAAAEPAPAKPKSDSDLPDWLAAAAAGAIAAEARTPDKPKAAAVPPPVEQPLPQALDTSAETFSLDESMPDWLSELPGGPSPAAIEASMKPTAPLGPLPGSPSAPKQPLAAKTEAPDWLKSAAVTAGAAKAASSVFTETPTAGDEALAMEMPDWLSGIKPAEAELAAAAPSQGAPAAAGSDSLTPGELPSWVQAMRPVEAVIAETAGDVDDEQFVESQGPLAGFQNVLPFVPGLIAIRRPAAYSSKLQVNTGQQNNAALLEGMLSSESDAAKVKHVSRLHYNKFLRWMIALLLIVLVSIPIMLGSTLTPTNSLFPRELVAANEVINALPQNPNVLVVFDYEPAFSSELMTASAPVLDQLLAKGAKVAAVSSLPTGSVQANLLFTTTMLRSYNYLNSGNYINLGYVPGGAAGIYNFVSNPSGTIPTDTQGNPIWTSSSSFLSNVKQLSDFDAMLVLVDSSETARAWIEQSRLPLGDKPLLTVVSAQSEPMILPYYDSKQIQGMVTGLFGGADYEKIIGRPGAGRVYWDAFAVAFFVAEVIVVVGGVWALIAAWQSRRARKDEEA